MQQRNSRKQSEHCTYLACCMMFTRSGMLTIALWWPASYSLAATGTRLDMHDMNSVECLKYLHHSKNTT